MAHHHVSGHDGAHHFVVQRVGDSGCHTRGHGHGQETGVDAVALGQTEAHVGRAAGGVDFELGAQAVHQAHDLHAGLVDRTNRHDQRVDHHVAGGNAVISGTFDNFLGHGKAHVGVLRNTGLVIGDSHHGRAVFFHQRQHGFQPVFLAGHRIHQGLAFVDSQTGFERGDD